MYEEKFLYQFKHLRKEVDGSIVYKTGSEHPLNNVSPLSKGELISQRKKIKRIKCNCSNPKFILKKCFQNLSFISLDSSNVYIYYN